MVSVKDRAKMFGTLASPGDTGKDRSYSQIGNKVSSSPFRSVAPPSTKLSPSPFKEKNAELPDEDGIPAPSPMKKNFGNAEPSLPPVAGQKFSNSPSPFKVLNNQNKNTQEKLSNFDSTKPSVPKRESPSPLKTVSLWEQRLKPKSAAPEKNVKILKSIVPKEEKNGDAASQETDDENKDENNLTDDANKAKPSRKDRLERARGAPVVITSVSNSLKQSLEAASAVMQEEKSEAGASDASSRSSLSNKELSNIAKRALQSVAAASPSERMNMKASRALAMRMSVGTRSNRASLSGSDVEKTVPTPSSDASRSRRIDHPAFAGRSSGHNMLASFHQFRNFQTKPKQSENKESLNKDREEAHSDDASMQSLEQEESMHSGRFDGSTPSNGKKYSGMGKIQISKNSCNDTVISSLSGNTQSLQSVTSKMISPRNNVQKTVLRLEPMPEDKSSALDGVFTPGPSNRSGHSIANSIISASPRPDYRSPSVREQHDPTFLDTLEEKSSSQESAQNTAELLDAALAVEDADILDSPRTNPSAFSDGSNLKILSSDSHSDSTPGFVFKDVEESDHMAASDHVNSFTPPEDENPTTKEALTNPRKHGTASTERTVSNSIRTGFSSIQEDVHEGSMSIRTGLSAVQRDSMEQSISIHTTVPNEDKEIADIEQTDGPKYPDTIEEESVAKSTQKSKLSVSDGSFGLKLKATVTTDGSSGTDPLASDQSAAIPGTNDNIVPPTEEGESEDMLNNGCPSKKKSFGKSIGNAIKTALVKASPRKNEENDDAESLFDEDEDDIFADLEEKPPRKTKMEMHEKSISLRGNGDLSQRTSESFSRRANGSLSRRTSQSNGRKSAESESARKMRKSGGVSRTPKKKPNTPSQRSKKIAASPSATAAPMATTDRYGTIVDESKVVHNVNSDITSSLIGGPFSGQHTTKKIVGRKNNETIEGIPESKSSKEEMGGSFTKFMDDTVTSSVEQKESDLNSETILDEDTILAPSSEDTEDTKDSQHSQRLGDMFLKFGYELVDSCNGFANLCNQGTKADDQALVGDGREKKDSASVSSRTTELTPLEKRVWREWDKLNVTEVLNIKKPNDATDGKKTGDKKSEEARTKAKSPSAESKSGDSFGDSYVSGGSFDYSQDYTRDTFDTGSYTTGGETETMMTDDQGRSVMSKPKPMLLSFSQRSLVEKFSKQLTAVGIQVLKLNTRKQWQLRYFTVSMEQIALSAHEAVNKTGEIAQCPKALLWLKKFNPKSGGYGIVNIDKNGHGGMLLVDLVDIQVSERRDDVLENPIPKKLQDRFENSVLLTLKYKMKGILRSIEFRCRDNDEAQFLCTCMRVIRDLLRRERSLRSKLSKQASLDTN